jgi:hypothetical protein
MISPSPQTLKPEKSMADVMTIPNVRAIILRNLLPSSENGVNYVFSCQEKGGGVYDASKYLKTRKSNKNNPPLTAFL